MRCHSCRTSCFWTLQRSRSQGERIFQEPRKWCITTMDGWCVGMLSSPLGCTPHSTLGSTRTLKGSSSFCSTQPVRSKRQRCGANAQSCLQECEAAHGWYQKHMVRAYICRASVMQRGHQMIAVCKLSTNLMSFDPTALHPASETQPASQPQGAHMLEDAAERASARCPSTPPAPCAPRCRGCSGRTWTVQPGRYARTSPVGLGAPGAAANTHCSTCAAFTSESMIQSCSGARNQMPVCPAVPILPSLFSECSRLVLARAAGHYSHHRDWQLAQLDYKPDRHVCLRYPPPEQHQKVSKCRPGACGRSLVCEPLQP